ncbi:hypothetical protein [Streptomyces sp. 7N604]|uniref:hypothetical protein n=1 Tax=Streptomyces sp. 7N604 TaxID=3457415 RepID=UPI003FCFE150
MVDDLGERAQSDVGRDGAAAHRQQGPYFTDGARDGGANAESAGQYVVGGTVSEVNEGGQQGVDEDQFVLCPGAHGPAARA